MGFSSRSPDPAVTTPLPDTPVVGARVRILGESGIFVVVRVDLRRYVVDVIRMDKKAQVEEGIHFALIQPLTEPRTFRPALWHEASSDAA